MKITLITFGGDLLDASGYGSCGFNMRIIENEIVPDLVHSREIVAVKEAVGMI